MTQLPFHNCNHKACLDLNSFAGFRIHGSLPFGNVSLWSQVQQLCWACEKNRDRGCFFSLSVNWFQLRWESWMPLCWTCFNFPIHFLFWLLSTSNFTCAAVPSIPIYIKGNAFRSSSAPQCHRWFPPIPVPIWDMPPPQQKVNHTQSVLTWMMQFLGNVCPIA